jgi:hypothetical protein
MSHRHRPRVEVRGVRLRAGCGQSVGEMADLLIHVSRIGRRNMETFSLGYWDMPLTKPASAAQTKRS